MSLRVLDSHTGGEPTRLVIEGAPTIEGTVQERLEVLKTEHDWIRRSLCLEPRGSEVAIGAIMFPPSLDDCLGDIVFFNNTGYLGMCGHGTIGVLASLCWKGDIKPGSYKINTVAGIVNADVIDKHTVSFENVASYRTKTEVEVDVPGFGIVNGDVAYGGNWFFLVKSGGPEVVQKFIPELMTFTSAVLDAVQASPDITEPVDHVEVYGSSTFADSKNFVLCPGKQYDRSPCGTGTSAELACLFLDGLLQEGEAWRQESIIVSFFDGSVRIQDGKIFPRIQGKAFVSGEVDVVVDPEDPFRHGIPAATE